MSTLTFGDMFPSDLSGHSKDIQAATVYTIQMTHRGSGIKTCVDVLALDPQMAEEMAGIELVEDGEAILHWTFDPPLARPTASVIRKLMIVGKEAAECAELRERTFAKRSAA